MIRRLSILVAAVGLIAAGPAEMTGQARVVDGDTFSVGAERVRLWGVDAPEGRQVCQDAQARTYACGDVARDQLVRLIGGRAVRCEIRDRDPYGRAVARCQAGSTDLGKPWSGPAGRSTSANSAAAPMPGSRQRPGRPGAAYGPGGSRRPRVGGGMRGRLSRRRLGPRLRDA